MSRADETTNQSKYNLLVEILAEMMTNYITKTKTKVEDLKNSEKERGERDGK